jgi:hypothetical protein
MVFDVPVLANSSLTEVRIAMKAFNDALERKSDRPLTAKDERGFCASVGVAHSIL